MTHRAKVTCPHCGRVNDAHLGVDRPTPTDGDIGVCWSCRGLAIFTVDGGRLGQRLPTAAEVDEIESDSRTRRLRGAMTESYRPSEAVELLTPEAQP